MLHKTIWDCIEIYEICDTALNYSRHQKKEELNYTEYNVTKLICLHVLQFYQKSMYGSDRKRLHCANQGPIHLTINYEKHISEHKK